MTLLYPPTRPDAPRLLLYTSLDLNQLSLDAPGNLGGVFAHEHVDFAAHAKVRQVNARLNREERVRHDQAFVVSLEVIHVGAIGVDRGADGVTCAMYELVAKSTR